MYSRMYLFVKSSDCLDVFPLNKANCFKVKVHGRISSRMYDKCCLINMSMPPVKDNAVDDVMVVVNFVRESIVGPTKLPIVYRYVSNNALIHAVNGWSSVYLPLRNIDTDVVEIQLLNGADLRLVELQNGVCYCTFHFVKL